jgi:DNA mismatch repair protein MutS
MKSLPPVNKHYFEMQLDCEKRYGKRTLLMYQIGHFLELFEITLEDGTKIGNASGMNNILNKMKGSENYIGYEYNGKTIIDYRHCGFPFNPESKEKYVMSATNKGYYVPIAYQTDERDPITKNTIRIIKETYSPTITPHTISGESSTGWFCGAIVKYNDRRNIKASVCLINPFTRIYHYKEGVGMTAGVPVILEIHDLLILYPPSEIYIWYVNENKDDDMTEEDIRLFLGIPNYTPITISELGTVPKDTPEMISMIQWSPTEAIPKIIVKTFTLLHSLYPEIIDGNRFRDNSESTSATMLLENQSLLQLNIISSNREGRESSVPRKLSSVISATDNTKTPMGKITHERWITSPSKIYGTIRQRRNICEYLLSNEANLFGWIQSLSKMKDITKLFSSKILGGISHNLVWDSSNTLRCFLYAVENYGIYDGDSRYPIDTESISSFINDVVDQTVDPRDESSVGNVSYNSYALPVMIDFPFTNNGCSLLGKMEMWNQYQEFMTLNGFIQTFIDSVNNLDSDTKTKKKYNLTFVYQDKQYSILVSGGKNSKYIPINKDSEWEKLGILKSEGSGRETYTIDPKTTLYTNRRDRMTLQSILNRMDSLRPLLDNSILSSWIQWSSLMKEKYEQTIQVVGDLIGMIDAIQSSAMNVIRNGFTLPIVKSVKHVGTGASYFKAKDLRHPLIEAINQKFKYVPNDIEITDAQRGHLIFGINSSGKSSLMKSIGIAIILAQAGLSVPASYLEIGIYDSIFTRIIGNDNLFRGQSTFEIESSELSRFLKMSTKNSIAIGDELCSGTEHYGAQAIVSASIEVLIRRNISFVFATHFQGLRFIPSLQDLQSLQWSHLLVVNQPGEGGGLKYIRKLMKGPGPIGYAIDYMEHMGTDEEMIEIARNNYKMITSEEYALRSIRRFSNDPETSNMSEDILTTSWNSRATLQNICQICKKAPAEEIDHIYERQFANKHGGIEGVGSVHHGGNLVSLCKECHRMKTNNDISIDGYIQVKSRGGIQRILEWKYQTPETDGGDGGDGGDDDKEETKNIVRTTDDISTSIIKRCMLQGRTVREIQGILKQNGITMSQIKIREYSKKLRL